jgi:hypothetical protein
MATPSYWLDLFTWKTWSEFLAAGAEVTGFRKSRWTTVRKIKPGDIFLCYLTGVSRFIGLIEVTSEPFQDDTPIWKDETFPCRLSGKLLLSLEPETAVPVHNLRDKLSIFQGLSSPHAWTGRVRGSPAKWKQSDGEAVVSALQAAHENPVRRPVDPRKLERRPRALKAKIGPVTVPESDDSEVAQSEAATYVEPTTHTEMQYLLLRLGSDMGFDVWVARNDRNREVPSGRFSEIFDLKSDLPLQFDEATTRTIELIDVLWLKGNAIVAAFEIESTTSIYSGLLRMADLIAMQPNLNIPLYLVAPDERREKVFTEVNRPTFSRLTPPLSDLCRFISFSVLQDRMEGVASVVRYLKPEFLEELSEVCDVEES